MKTRDFILYSRYDGMKNDARFMVWMSGATEVKGWWQMIQHVKKVCEDENCLIGKINLYAHGEAEGFFVGEDAISVKVSKAYGKSLRILQGKFTSRTILELDVCGLGHNDALIQSLSEAGGITIRAYRDLQNANWISPRGEGPSKICAPDGKGCVKESDDPWTDAAGARIIKGHIVLPGGVTFEMN